MGDATLYLVLIAIATVVFISGAATLNYLVYGRWTGPSPNPQHRSKANGVSLRTRFSLYALAVSALTLVLCIATRNPRDKDITPIPAPQPQFVAADPKPATDPCRVFVSRQQFGDKWPLTVESGEVECLKGFIILFHTSGKTYALNGGAIDSGYSRIEPIWQNDPQYPGLKVSITPLLKVGLDMRQRCR